MKTQYVLNGNCKYNDHKQCPGKSKGSASDPVNFVCTCKCHDEEN